MLAAQNNIEVGYFVVQLELRILELSAISFFSLTQVYSLSLILQQFRMDFGNQWAGAAYYGGPVYDGYGYALPPQHDPSMYAAAAAYGAYPVYGTHQQQVS